MRWRGVEVARGFNKHHIMVYIRFEKYFFSVLSGSLVAW